MRVSHKVEVTCLNCGKTFDVRPLYRAKGRGKFCDRKCYGEWQSKNRRGVNSLVYKRVSLVCETCGKEFKVPPSTAKAGRRYCSKGCYVWVQPRKLDQRQLRENLTELYVGNKLTINKIARKFHCDSKTIIYWLEKFNIPRRSRSENFRLNNPAKRPDVRKKMSEKAKLRGQKPEERKRRSDVAKKLWLDPEFRIRKIRQLKESNKGKNNPNYGNRYHHSDATKQHLREQSKKNWRNSNYARKVITSLQKEPNQLEMKLAKLIECNAFPFKYVGDGKVVVDGQVPDFFATDESKKVIELFGTPWHDPNHSNKIKVKPCRTEEAKKKFYTSHGYDCLVVWDNELKDEAKVAKKIECFLQA